MNGHAVVMSTLEIAGIHKSSLGDKIASLADHRDEIIAMKSSPPSIS